MKHKYYLIIHLLHVTLDDTDVDALALAMLQRKLFVFVSV